jgi:outer membrane biosynthesis protein TonB
LGDGKPAPDTKPAQPAPQPVPAQKPAHHNHKPAPQPPAQEAANPPSSVSAVGQLSSGGSGDLRAQTDDLINQTEKGVNGITRPLTDAELKTIAQIREFLKQARQALTTGDLDGAHTLAMKAKVLLAELNP